MKVESLHFADIIMFEFTTLLKAHKVFNKKMCQGRGGAFCYFQTKGR